MVKYRIIGNMTGNSMDAIDLVLTEFNDDQMSDICTFTKAYSKDMQDKIDKLRRQVFNKTKSEILSLADFKPIHDEYINQIACSINEMLSINNIDKSSVDAIGFHGKTLDHNPPSKVRGDTASCYTLQIGSGQMLANLTQIPVVYDFRSAYILNGFDGAPLVGPHNARISITEGNGCYYNGGNTSNFAIINDHRTIISADSGPFNEYTDAIMRRFTSLPFDQNAEYGKKGKLNKELMQELYNIGRDFYNTELPRSGDPSYYHQDKVFELVAHQNIKLEDAVHTFEYFAAYIAAQALTMLPENISLPNKFILFGGGWKNPLVLSSFEDILCGNSYVLPEHQKKFAKLRQSFSTRPEVYLSDFGAYMEARLFADMARYKLQNKVWEISEVIDANKNIVSGNIALPNNQTDKFTDMISQAAKGWQDA